MNRFFVPTAINLSSKQVHVCTNRRRSIIVNMWTTAKKKRFVTEQKSDENEEVKRTKIMPKTKDPATNPGKRKESIKRTTRKQNNARRIYPKNFKTKVPSRLKQSKQKCRFIRVITEIVNAKKPYNHKGPKKTNEKSEPGFFCIIKGVNSLHRQKGGQ